MLTYQPLSEAFAYKKEISYILSDLEDNLATRALKAETTASLEKIEQRMRANFTASTKEDNFQAEKTRTTSLTSKLKEHIMHLESLIEKVNKRLVDHDDVLTFKVNFVDLDETHRLIKTLPTIPEIEEWKYKFNKDINRFSDDN